MFILFSMYRYMTANNSFLLCMKGSYIFLAFFKKTMS